MDWQIIYYSDSRGNEPVRAFIDTQSTSAQASIFHAIDLLKEFGLAISPLFVKKITKSGLWELRIHHSSDYYRIFYFAFTGRRFVLLHAFLKKTAKTPVRDIETALKRMSDYRHRRD